MSDHAVILVVEDREDDILLLRTAFRKAGLLNPIHFVRDGEEAVAYLRGEGKYASRAEYPLPDLMLLDLKLPRMDGIEVLKWVRQQEGIRGLPVVVLTSSERIQDVNRAYEFGANSFFVKEIDFDNLVSLNQVLHRYWLKTARRPETSRPATQVKRQT
jgi:CheY-like chemotaxis protein